MFVLFDTFETLETVSHRGMCEYWLQLFNYIVLALQLIETSRRFEIYQLYNLFKRMKYGASRWKNV